MKMSSRIEGDTIYNLLEPSYYEGMKLTKDTPWINTFIRILYNKIGFKEVPGKTVCYFCKKPDYPTPLKKVRNQKQTREVMFPMLKRKRGKIDAVNALYCVVCKHKIDKTVELTLRNRGDWKTEKNKSIEEAVKLLME